MSTSYTFNVNDINGQAFSKFIVYNPIKPDFFNYPDDPTYDYGENDLAFINLKGVGPDKNALIHLFFKVFANSLIPKVSIENTGKIKCTIEATTLVAHYFLLVKLGGKIDIKFSRDKWNPSVSIELWGDRLHLNLL